jgi:hypothetical protein
MAKTLSPKQLAANRANAAKSTGPRTPHGKARSSQNARTHGLTAEKFAILRIEDPAEIERIKAGTVAAYRPATSEELFAVERIAVCKVAIVRAARLEAGLFTSCLNQALNDDNVTPFVPLDPLLTADLQVGVEQNRNFALADGFERMARNSNSWSLFLRYQAQAERQYRRALEAFENLKALRGELRNEPILDAQSEPHEPVMPPSDEPIPPGSCPENAPARPVSP